MGRDLTALLASVKELIASHDVADVDCSAMLVASACDADKMTLIKQLVESLGTVPYPPDVIGDEHDSDSSAKLRHDTLLDYLKDSASAALLQSKRLSARPRKRPRARVPVGREAAGAEPAQQAAVDARACV